MRIQLFDQTQELFAWNFQQLRLLLSSAEFMLTCSDVGLVFG